MGNFLSTPRTDKETYVGEGNGISYGVSSMQGWRSSMEDTHVAQTEMPGFKGCSIFAVFDGHGGKLVAQESAQRLVDTLTTTLDDTKSPMAIGDALERTYFKIDDDLRELDRIDLGEDQSGCTAIAAFINDRHVIVANTGDSRGVLATAGNTVIPMSMDHKPNNPTERSRIEKAGGVVRNNRVNGDLAVSRALGDFYFKERSDLSPEEQQVSAEPDIKVQDRSADNEFLLLACDGVWDAMSNEEACSYVRSLMARGESNLGLICEEVLDHCLSLGSRDNMSIVLIKFAGAKIGSGDGVMGLRKERAEAEQIKRQEELMRQDALRQAPPAIPSNAFAIVGLQ
ncbi:hypothetical protein AeNC1_013357 [Aphanomyces euteiches]|nr:hypothetical protein AeNC1_013357 [Aphanomyces euteiches]